MSPGSRIGQRWWLMAIMSVVSSPVLLAAEPIMKREMSEIVVTATRLPTQRLRVGSSTSVITSADIARKQLRTVPQALQTLPGLHVVQQGGTGQQTSVFMRGANSNHTLVLIDGIEANDPSSPSGAVDFANLLVDNIDRIEVVRGPQSTLYGSDAIGGVINIITRKGEGKPEGMVRAEGGSHDTVNTKAGLSGANGPFDFSASLSYLDTDSNSVTPRRLRDGARKEKDAYDNWTASARLGWAVTETVEASFVGRYIKVDKTNTDPELTDEDGFGTTEDRDAFVDQTQYFLRGQGKASLLDGVWDSTLAVSYTEYDRKNRNDRDDPNFETLERSDFDGDKLKYEWKNDFYLHDDHTVTAGVETEKENAKSSSFRDQPGVFGPSQNSSTTDADARTSAVYLQDQFSFGDRWFGTAGLRVDHHDDFGSEPTFRIAPVYLHTETATRVAASIGTGFKAPSLDQLFGILSTSFGDFVGNPDLDPEKSFGWDLGVEQKLAGGRLGLGATFFWSRIEDLIGIDSLPDSSGFTNVNVNEAHIHGVEAFVAANLMPKLSVRVDYTYTHAEDDETDKRLFRRPKNKLNGDVHFIPVPQATLSASLVYVSDWVDIPRTPSFAIERINPSSYAVLDLAASYALNKWLTVLARVDNVTDERYEPADGFEALGRGFFAGVQVKL